MQRPPPPAATPMAFVRAIVSAYAQRQIGPEAALQAAQIEPAALESRTACVSAAAFERLAEHAMRELDDEALGWFARRLPWGSYGMLARASISAPTLGLALQRWCRHHGLLVDEVRLHLRLSTMQARLEIEELRDLGARREFCHVSLLRNALGFASWLIDSRIALQACDFACPRPAHHASYALLFPGVQRFAAERSALVFDAGYLALPLRRDETALRQMLRHALPLLVQPYRRDRLLLQRVRQALCSQPTLHAAQLAQQLNLSLRTLHRQLRHEGHSLQQIKDEVRLELATQALWRSDLPLKQIAQLAGFRSEQSFSRAFSLWCGQTPAAYRRSQPAPVPPEDAAPP